MTFTRVVQGQPVSIAAWDSSLPKEARLDISVAGNHALLDFETAKGLSAYISGWVARQQATLDAEIGIVDPSIDPKDFVSPNDVGVHDDLTIPQNPGLKLE